MNNCKSCKHLYARDIICYCGLNGGIVIKHPLFMGGSKRCECYEKRVKVKVKFEYSKKEDFNNESKQFDN